MTETQATRSVVMVGDLVESRKIAERSRFARQLERMLETAAQRWRDDWQAPLVSTRGIDELSGVLHSAHPIFDIIVYLNEGVWPAQFRFAVVEGIIDVEADSTDASAMDGPAFHAASREIRYARDQGLPLRLKIPDFSSASLRLAEATALLHATILNDCTERQIEVLRTFRESETQTQVAEQLAVAPQTVQRHLAKMHFSELENARNSLSAFFSSRQED